MNDKEKNIPQEPEAIEIVTIEGEASCSAEFSEGCILVDEEK